MSEEFRPVCMICERECDEHEGIKILSQFICTDCEKDIVNTNVDDDLYDYFVEKLRTLWLDIMRTDIDPPPGTPYS